MGTRVSIGDFSVMTRLSKKALRYYHSLGLLEPTHVDAHSGYRFYDTDQVDRAHLIRRFRSLGISVPDIQALLGTDDVDERNEIITAHLKQTEELLQQTQDAVQELGELLSPTRPTAQVELRSEPRVRVWSITSTVDIDEIGAWFASAAELLDAAFRKTGAQPTGPAGGLYERSLFTESRGAATLFVPTDDAVTPPGTVQIRVIEAGEVAVLTHHGSSHCTIDRSYGQLGSYVNEHLISDQGPLREHYLGGCGGSFTEFDRTEICWPVFSTAR